MGCSVLGNFEIKCLAGWFSVVDLDETEQVDVDVTFFRG